MITATIIDNEPFCFGFIEKIEILEDYSFAGVHHSYLVNLNKIEKYIKGECLPYNGRWDYCRGIHKQKRILAKKAPALKK